MMTNKRVEQLEMFPHDQCKELDDVRQEEESQDLSENWEGECEGYETPPGLEDLLLKAEILEADIAAQETLLDKMQEQLAGILEEIEIVKLEMETALD